MGLMNSRYMRRLRSSFLSLLRLRLRKLGRGKGTEQHDVNNYIQSKLPKREANELTAQ